MRGMASIKGLLDKNNLPTTGTVNGGSRSDDGGEKGSGSSGGGENHFSLVVNVSKLVRAYEFISLL